MKVALYARVSTKKQDNINQVPMLKAYVASKPEWTLHNVYEDIETGSTSQRTQLDALLKDARMGLFQHVVFTKVDRLARSPLVFYQILDEWKNLGITYSITSIDIDTSTPVGKFVIGLLEQVAELEREFIRQRTNDALDVIKDKLEKGIEHTSKSGRVITKLGRPKGKKDNHPRRKSGYNLRWQKVSEQRKQRARMKVNKSPIPMITKNE